MKSDTVLLQIGVVCLLVGFIMGFVTCYIGSCYARPPLRKDSHARPHH